MEPAKAATISGHQPHHPICHHRLRILLAVLLTWQVTPFAISGFAHLVGVGRDFPKVSSTDEALVSSLTNPTDDDIAESLRIVREMRDAHRAQFANRGHVDHVPTAGKSPRSAMGGPASGYPASATAKLDLFGIPLYHGDAPHRAIKAVEAGCYNDSLVPLLHRLPSSPPNQNDVWKRRSDLATVLVHVIHKRYRAAAALLSTDKWPYEEQRKTAHTSLRHLVKHPADFDARLQLVDAIKNLAHGHHFLIPFVDLYCLLYDDADTELDRAKVLFRLAPLRPKWGKTTLFESARALYTAASRILAKSEGDEPLASQCITALGDFEERIGNTLLATVVYETVIETYPKAATWGRCVYNRAYLLRKLGFPDQAAKTLMPIFSSNVNDREPGAHIMTAYRNYRHRSASEIARCFSDLWNFPRSYCWSLQAAKRYPSFSWCGNCRRGAERRAQRTLLVTSLKAGPVFLAATLLISPLANWYVWCSGGALVLLRRRLRKRRARQRHADDSSLPAE